MKLGDLKIGVKLGASFGIVVALFVAMSFFMLNRISVMKTLQDEGNKRAEDAIMVKDGQMKIDELYGVIADAIINRNMTKTDREYAEKKKEIDETLALLDKMVDTDEERGWAKDIRGQFGEFFTIVERQLFPDFRAGRYELVKISEQDAKIDEIRAAIEKDFTKVVLSIQAEHKRGDQAFDAVANQAFVLSIIVVIIAVILAFFLALLITRNMTALARQIIATLNLVAEGDMTQRTGLRQKDEFGVMAAALDRTVDRVGAMVAGVISSAQNLSQAVQQIAAGNENLSQRTSEQASSLEEIASTVEQATAAINQNAEHSTTANTASRDASALATEGNAVVSEAVRSITTINESSRKIAEIIGVINDIAFQTNLLALNAAVEAARAGEQGRGFAVVAGEVRNLAQRSGNAAKEIETLIKDSVVKVEAGTTLVTKSGESLEKIGEAINRVTTIVTEIAAASQEQKQGMGQVNLAVTELDRMTQDNASLVEETASASEEMANQADELLIMVKRFTVDQNLVSSATEAGARTAIHIGHKAPAQGVGAGPGTATRKRVAQSTQPKESAQLKTILKDEGFEEF